MFRLRKRHKGQHFIMGTVIQEAITMWCHWQPQDFYIHGTDTHETVGCLSEHPCDICQTTWSSGCAVHTVCLFNKQPLSNIFSIYTSPYLVMQILFCGDSKVDHENGDSTLLWYTDYTVHFHTPPSSQDRLYNAMG